MDKDQTKLLEKLAEFGEYLANYGTIDDIYDNLISDACQFFPDAIGGLLYHRVTQTDAAKCFRRLNVQNRQSPETNAALENLVTKCAHNNEILFEHIHGDFLNLLQREQAGAICIVPLEFENTINEILVLCFKEKNELYAQDLYLFDILSRQLAAAINTKKMHATIVYDHRLLDALRRFGDAAMSVDLHRFLDQFTLAALHLDQSNVIVFWYLHPWQGTWQQHVPPHLHSLCHSFPDIANYEGIAGFVLRTKRLYNCPDVTKDPHYHLTFPDVQSEIAIPIFDENQVVAVLDIQSQLKNAFTSMHEQFFQLLALYAASTYQKIQIMRIADHKNREVITLKSIGESLGQQKSLQEVLQMIADESLKLVGHGKMISTVMLWDDEKEMMETRAIAGEEAKKYFKNLSIPLSQKSVVTSVIKTQKPRVISNVSHAEDYLNIVPSMCSEVCVPFFFHGKLVGVIDLESSTLNAFSQNDVELLKTLGESASISVKVGELVDIRLQQLEALYKTGTKLNSDRSLQDVLRTVAQESLKALGSRSRSVYIQLYEEESDDFVIHVAVGNPQVRDYVGDRMASDKGLSGQVFRTKKHYLCSDVSKDRFYTAINSKTKSELCVPILFMNEVIGIINAESQRKSDFGLYDVELLKNMANQASVAIENARLSDELSLTQFQLNKAIEMAFLGETLAGLSHDIRTSTSLISGEAQWIERQCNTGSITPEETLRSMQKIKE